MVQKDVILIHTSLIVFESWWTDSFENCWIVYLMLPLRNEKKLTVVTRIHQTRALGTTCQETNGWWVCHASFWENWKQSDQKDTQELIRIEIRILGALPKINLFWSEKSGCTNNENIKRSEDLSRNDTHLQFNATVKKCQFTLIADLEALLHSSESFCRSNRPLNSLGTKLRGNW